MHFTIDMNQEDVQMFVSIHTITEITISLQKFRVRLKNFILDKILEN